VNSVQFSVIYSFNFTSLLATQAERTAQLAQAQQQLSDSAVQMSVATQYYDRLFRTLGSEFVMAVKHIGSLELALSAAGLAVPARPDFANHDVDAPPLPPLVQHAVNQHAAAVVAHAAAHLETEADENRAPVDEALIRQQMQQHELAALQQQQHMMAMLYQQQQLFEQQQLQQQQQQQQQQQLDDAGESDADDAASL